VVVKSKSNVKDGQVKCGFWQRESYVPQNRYASPPGRRGGGGGEREVDYSGAVSRVKGGGKIKGYKEGNIDRRNLLLLFVP